MLTVLSNIRKSNVYLMVAVILILAVTILAVVRLALAVAPSITAAEPALVPITGVSEYADYYQRHPELRAPAATAIDTTDYFVRHPELRPPVQSIDLSDYFLRHPELRSK